MRIVSAATVVLPIVSKRSTTRPARSPVRGGVSCFGGGVVVGGASVTRPCDGLSRIVPGRGRCGGCCVLVDCARVTALPKSTNASNKTSSRIIDFAERTAQFCVRRASRVEVTRHALNTPDGRRILAAEKSGVRCQTVPKRPVLFRDLDQRDEDV